MLKRILALFLAGRLFRLFAGGRGFAHTNAFRHAYPRRWVHHHHGMRDLVDQMGLQRRRRSFI